MPAEAETASAWARAGSVMPFGQGLDEVGFIPVNVWGIFTHTGKTEGEAENSGTCTSSSLWNIKLFNKKTPRKYFSNRKTNYK